MEEFEKAEAELKQVHATYVEKFRNLHFLESELDKYRQKEREKQLESDRQLKRMQKRYVL